MSALLSAIPASATAGLATPSAGATASTVANAPEPAAVRDGSTKVKQAYAAAQSFEEMLLQQLSQSLMQSAGLTGEGEGGGGGESGEEGASAGGAGEMYSSMLPQTLTEGVIHSGGLGLATQLLDTLDPSAATAGAGSTSTTAGAAPPQAAAGASASTAAPPAVSGAAAAPIPGVTVAPTAGTAAASPASASGASTGGLSA